MAIIRSESQLNAPCLLLLLSPPFHRYWSHETVADFIFLGSKITVDGDCSHEIKRQLLLGRKVMKNLDSVLKSRDITLPTKVCLENPGDRGAWWAAVCGVAQSRTRLK